MFSNIAFYNSQASNAPLQPKRGGGHHNRAFATRTENRGPAEARGSDRKLLCYRTARRRPTNHLSLATAGNKSALVADRIGTFRVQTVYSPARTAETPATTGGILGRTTWLLRRSGTAVGLQKGVRRTTLVRRSADVLTANVPNRSSCNESKTAKGSERYTPRGPPRVAM